MVPSGGGVSAAPVRIAFWFNWLLLISLSIGLALSLADFRTATHYVSAPLLLQPGTQLTLETERLLPGRPHLSLTFRRPPPDYDQPDPVLGNWQNSQSVRRFPALPHARRADQAEGRA